MIRAFGLDNASSISSPMDVSMSNVLAPYSGDASNYELKRYQSGIGSILYAMTQTRPDLGFPASALSRYSQNPGPTYWKAA